MPVIDVQLVGPEAAVHRPGLAANLADAAGAALKAAPGRVWVRLSLLPLQHYAENGVAQADTPQPVFVTVLHAQLPEAALLAAEALSLSAAIASVLGCDADRVHIEYASPGRGRVAFGGRLLT